MNSKIIFFIIIASTASTSAFSQQAWSYLGIPYVTDNVPDELMPAIPDGAHAPAFPYDPCTIPTPTFNDGANQYYVDSENGNDSTAGNSGRGSIAKPRKSFPNASGNKITLNEGDQIFITANSEFFSGGADRVVISNGTSSNICWIIGVGGRPKFGGDKFFMGGQHIIIDNILFESPSGMRVKFGNSTENVYTQYGTIRNCILDGLGGGKTGALGGSGLSASERTSFICIYNNTVRNMGDWNRQDSNGVDRHGIQMTKFTDHWWIIENDIYHCEGDSVQVNTSSQNDGDYERRPHYIYIAGNNFYENYENAVDNKNCYHVIVSENNMYSFHNEFKSANKTAVILANDSEGWLSGYEWAIFNTIRDAGTGFKIAANAALTIDNPNASTPVQTAGQRSYIIGNLLYDVDTGINLDARGTNQTGALGRTWFEETWIVNNTIVSKSKGINQQRGSTGQGEYGKHTVIGNIIYNTGNSPEIDLDDFTSQINEVLYNVVYRKGGNVELPTAKYNVYTGNTVNIDPQFIDLANDNYLVDPNSPAVNLAGYDSTPSPYDTFEAMYGLNIRVDFNKENRPSGGGWDVGAFEYQSGTGTIPTDPSTLQVTAP